MNRGLGIRAITISHGNKADVRPLWKTWRLWWKPILIGVVAIIFNVVTYILLPHEVVAKLGSFGYLSAFVIAGIANATVLVPVPYYPIIARLGQVLNVWGVIIAAAAGSTLGETVAFLVGRSGHEAVEGTRINGWIGRQMRRPWRAAVTLLALSAPPNPAFDVAGLFAGALGIPLWLFLVSVFLGRIIRMGLVVFAGMTLEWL